MDVKNCKRDLKTFLFRRDFSVDCTRQCNPADMIVLRHKDNKWYGVFYIRRSITTVMTVLGQYIAWQWWHIIISGVVAGRLLYVVSHVLKYWLRI